MSVTVEAEGKLDSNSHSDGMKECEERLKYIKIKQLGLEDIMDVVRGNG